MILCVLIGTACRFSVRAESTGLRALLIGCDEYVTQQNTLNASHANLDLMGEALSLDSRGYELIRTCYNTVSSSEKLSAALDETFAAAGEDSVSLIYFSCHGIRSENGTVLVLSDGVDEYLLDPQTLYRYTDRIRGTKVLIIDSCYSGAFIGKGMDDPEAERRFGSPGYVILCSGGGTEQSWYWQNEDSAVGYFTLALTDMLGRRGGFAGDMNADGVISPDEIYRALLSAYALTTPQIYPQSDRDFVLFQYDQDTVYPFVKSITDVTLDPFAADGIALSFTVQKKTKLFYQIVYWENGAWLFDHINVYGDLEQLDGSIAPGRKTRLIAPDTDRSENYGYAMLVIFTRENGVSILQSTHLIFIPPAAGEAAVSINLTNAFSPDFGQEALIGVSHAIPCEISVSIADSENDLVTRLCYGEPSRPLYTEYYWDGRDRYGETVPAGVYTVTVRCGVGEEIYTEKGLITVE